MVSMTEHSTDVYFPEHSSESQSDDHGAITSSRIIAQPSTRFLILRKDPNDDVSTISTRWLVNW